MAKSVQKKSSNSRFVGVIFLVAIVGVAALGYAVGRPRAGIKPVDPNLPAGTAEGFLIGSADAPVQVIEFLDYECGGCAQFAMVTEPDIRERLINTGQMAMRIYDFPLDGHRHSWPAANAVACAKDQNKYVAMHDQVFATQDQWNGEATTDPKKVFLRVAGEIGLNTADWETCFDSQKHYPAIKGSLQEGIRRGVNVTPSFIIGSKLIPGGPPFDEFRKYVEEAAAEVASAAKSAKAPSKAARP